MSGAAARLSHVQSGQPCARPSISGSTIAVRPTVISPIPTRSRRPAPSTLDSGTTRGSRTSATRPIGMLIRKQARQPSPSTSAWISRPPISWPSTAARPERHPVDAEGAGALLALVDHAQDREHLRRHERRADPLHEAGRDERAARGREAAGRRGDREDEHARPEHPPAADPVAESPGGHEADGGGQPVARDDPLDHRRAGLQVEAQRRDRDVDDEEVEDDHEGRRQEQREGGPLALPHARQPALPGRLGGPQDAAGARRSVSCSCADARNGARARR